MGLRLHRRRLRGPLAGLARGEGLPAYPVGSTVPSDTRTGDTIQLSGYGLGYGTTRPTQEQRTAIHSFDDTEMHAVSGPIHWGDSGGPLVNIGTGKALGIVSHYGTYTTDEGPLMSFVLSELARAGFSVTLATA